MGENYLNHVIYFQELSSSSEAYPVNVHWRGGNKAVHTLREIRSKVHYESKVSLQLTVTRIQDV